MNVASKGLCQELYELSGWNDTKYGWLAYSDWETHEWSYELSSIDKKHWIAGAYDLGYLLRKSPKYISIGQMIASDETWIATCTKFHPNKHPYCAAETPEDALCKLTIELFKQKILVEESQ